MKSTAAWPIILLVTLTQPAESQRVEDSPAESPRLTLLKRELEQADRPALDQFWAERKDHVPLVEPLHNQNGFLLVTFVWRDSSAPSSILLHGGPPSQLPKMLRHLAGTDLWFRTELIPTDARFTYGFEVRTNLDSAIEPRVMPDPLNHQRFDGRSVLEMPDAPPQPWISRVPGLPQGKVTRYQFQSKHLHEERTIGIYTPPQYSATGKRCNLLVVFDGNAYQGLIPLPVILDNLIGRHQIPPTVAIGIPNPSQDARRRDLHCYEPFADFVAEELVPWARKTYNTASDPHRIIVAGSSAGGLTAAFCAFRFPKVFGNVLSQSGSFWYSPGQSDSVPDYAQERGWLTRQFVSTSRLPIRFYLETGRFEFQAQVFDHHRIRDVLEAKGYQVIYREYNGGHDYLNWRGTFGDALVTLLTNSH